MSQTFQIYLVRLLIATTLFTGTMFSQHHPDLQEFSYDFFSWRAITQPATSDDINRVERPVGWVPDYSPESLVKHKQRYQDFRSRLSSISRQGWSRSDSVDYLLLHSAVERVNWELNVLRLPERNPDFYIHQTLGILFELLLIHSPMTGQRAQELLTRFRSIPKTLEHGMKNLTDPVSAFADIALSNGINVRNKLRDCVNALKPVVEPNMYRGLLNAAEDAADALENYLNWLADEQPRMSNRFSVGREQYEYFLRQIALIPYDPDQLLLMGAQEWDRSVSFYEYELKRNEGLAESRYFRSSKAQIARSKRDEISIRRFLERKDIMSVPVWLQHYNNLPIPPWLAPLSHMGVNDDLTSETRLNENAVSYIPEPGPNLAYFNRSSAQDPRPIIIHEGVPGHYFQMAISWANKNPIRRHFFDSGPIEGIGFYVEELMLQHGLFEDRPRTREIIYSFMRLRALRVDVDVKLALGIYSIEGAAKFLEETVPMDHETALWEARFFSLTPGQAISYQIGKLQIMSLIADARVKFGDNFSLRHYHDYMMENGNIPIALQHWEYLEETNDLLKLWQKHK